MATVLLSGASGFIGKRLQRHLTTLGHRIATLSRASVIGPDVVRWDPEAGEIDAAAMRRVHPDMVINLAGEPIAQRWTPARRRRIRSSRVNGTTALARAIAALPDKPSVFVSGSAIGYYGMDRGDQVLDEDADAGTDYLGDVAKAWELATAPAADAGIRVALIRTGIVLGREGGVLQRMVPPFRFGVGGRLASGHQWMSWISAADEVGAIDFITRTTSIRGPVNLVAPQPARNIDFTRALARAVRRPAVLPLPAFVLRLIFGEMANATLLANQRVLPKKLAGAGYVFRHPELDTALRAELTRSGGRDDR
jgi:uncharacterized protein